MKKILFITNIPVPYRIDFYNELGKYVDLTVIFEAKTADNQGIKFNWNLDDICNFKAIFLREGDIEERKVNWKIFKYITKDKYDAIIATNYSYFTEMAAIVYMKFRGIKYFMETDGGIIRNENILKKLYKKFLISGAVGYFSPSSHSDKYLMYYGAKKEVIYRYPFTSLKQADILPKTLTINEKLKYKKELGIQCETMVIAIGQFIHRKGFDILIESCKNIGNDVGVYIIGGKVTDEYLNLVKNLNVKNIYFEDFKTKELLIKYLKAADIFVLPTREDIWGLVINEAMAMGLPVITTKACVSGLELVKDNYNGYMINVESVDELETRLNQLIKKDLSKMSQRSLDIISEYSIENMVKKHLDVLEGGHQE